MLTTLINQSNLSLPATPPVSYIPNSIGVDVPMGMKSWNLSFDQANIPSNVEFTFSVQFLVNGNWITDTSGTFKGGSFTGASGSTTINGMSSSIGGIDINGDMVGSYPTAVRLVVNDLPADYVLPSLSLTMT